MNKKIIALVLVFALAVCSVFASNSLLPSSTSGTSKKNGFSAGVAAGTNVVAVAKYGLGKCDLQLNLGLNFLKGNAFYVDLGAFYNVYTISFNTGTFTKTQNIPLTVGLSGACNIASGKFSMDVLALLGAEYTWSKVPVTMFLKAGAGLGLDFSDSGVKAGVSGYGVLGAVYNFY